MQNTNNKGELNGNYKHGIYNTRIYHIWQQMKIRCYDKKAISYNNYGGRGIIVCEEWLNNPCAFYEWAITNGYGDNLQIDRIDNNGNYEPSNCRWLDKKGQARNRRSNHTVEINGEKHLLVEWAEICGVSLNTINQRYLRGERGERLIRPIKRG